MCKFVHEGDLYVGVAEKNTIISCLPESLD